MAGSKTPSSSRGRTRQHLLCKRADYGVEQRAAQLRQQIEQLYTREREIEGHVTAAAADAAATANTITLDKPVAVKVKYGMATIPPGTTLTVISRDANGILVDYADEKVTLPP